MNHLRKKHHLNVDLKKCGSNFAKCMHLWIIEGFDIQSWQKTRRVQKNMKWNYGSTTFMRNLVHVFITLGGWINPVQRKVSLYHPWQDGLVVHDNFCSQKTYYGKKKRVLGLGQLPITFIGTISHCHGNEMFVQYNSNRF